jgi:hypothetical protein
VEALGYMLAGSEFERPRSPATVTVAFEPCCALPFEFYESGHHLLEAVSGFELDFILDICGDVVHISVLRNKKIVIFADCRIKDENGIDPVCLDSCYHILVGYKIAVVGLDVDEFGWCDIESAECVIWDDPLVEDHQGDAH